MLVKLSKGNSFKSPQHHVSVARSQNPTGPYKRSNEDYFLHIDLVFNEFKYSTLKFGFSDHGYNKCMVLTNPFLLIRFQVHVLQ